MMDFVKFICILSYLYIFFSFDVYVNEQMFVYKKQGNGIAGQFCVAGLFNLCENISIW